jgi:hypothetical protein
MAENTISRALSIVHQKRLQEDGLWRLDSPTVSVCCLVWNTICRVSGQQLVLTSHCAFVQQEAALVAQLCNRQQDEVSPSLSVLRLPALQQVQELAGPVLPSLAPLTTFVKVFSRT